MIDLFINGSIPASSADVNRFIQQYQAGTDRERLAVALQVRDFTPVQVSDFCLSVLSRTNDEALHAMVYLDPETVEKMTHNNLLKNLSMILFKWKIRPGFFDQCAASLITHCNPGLGFNVMGELSTVMDVADKSINFMPLEGTSFDRAVAANFEETLQNVLTYDDFAHYIGTFLRFDLPCTFGVLLNSSNSEHMDEMVNRAVELLFANNKLSEGYVEVCRRVMGDERFLGICKNEYEKTASSGSPLKTGSLRSVAYLSAIFGEETFHSTKFFEGIFAQDGEGHVPRHVRQFSIIGFDDLDLPVLRGLIVSNLERLVFFKPSYTNELEITLNLCRLAHQQGAGEAALRLLLKRVGEVAGGETHADQASVVIDDLVGASVPSVGSRGNALLKHVVELVGLNTLKEVVPDVGTAFLSQFIDEKKPALTEVEIIHLFPQMKANLLESSLGL